VVFWFAARAPGDSEWAKQAAAMRALKAERGQKHGHESRIAEPDWQPIIRAFKQVYCDGFQDRSPKKSRRPESPRA
jgi:hypothetical protein